MTRSAVLSSAGSLPTLLAGAVVILAPILSLLVWQTRVGGMPLAVGAGILTALAVLFGFRPGLLELIRSPILLVFPVLGWMLIYLSEPSMVRGLGHLLSGLLLGIISATLLVQELHRGNNSRVRRARTTVARLLARGDWPVQLSDCIHVPEVHALKICLRDDPSPAFAMLIQANGHVRYAALLAMQDRTKWERKHAQILLEMARQLREPIVKAAAISALNSSRDPRVIDGIAEFVNDPRKEVRRAAVVALMSNPGRWTQYRHAIRSFLCDPKQIREGPIPLPSAALPDAIVQDLSLWTSETGPIGIRSAQTLVEHYRRALSEGVSHSLSADLAQKVLDPRVPAAVRVEFAHLLREANDVPRDALDAMLSGQHPAAVRLLAVESLMTRGENARAIVALRELALVPHRETSLAVAAIIQNRLRIDMGLPYGKPLPPTKDKLAAEVSRRVQEWAVANRVSESPKPAAVAAGVPAALATNRIDGLVFDAHLDAQADSGEWDLNPNAASNAPRADLQVESEAENSPWLA